MDNPLYVGIDVSATDNKVQFLDASGTALDKFVVSNNLYGAKTLVQKVCSRFFFNGCTSLFIGLEATSIYAENLVYYLKTDSQLCKYKPKIHLLNPKQVANFKKAYSELPKNDWVDAWVIADNLRFGRVTKEVWFDEQYISLQKLTRARFRLVEDIAREKNRFLNHLFLKFNGMYQEQLFSNTFGVTSQALISEFLSPDEILNTSIDDLAKFLIQKSKNKFEDPEQLAKDIQKAARASYRLPRTINDSVNQVLASSYAVIRCLSSQVNSLDKAIEKQLELIPNTLTSVKGIGPVYCGGIIAEIGDIERFHSHSALAKYAGLAWKEHQSGNFRGDSTPAISSGNRYLKYYLIEAANSVRMHDPEFKRFYQQKYRTTSKTPHKRALALTARKLVRLIDSLLRSGRLYKTPREV